jgi:enoyl-CoA hydratase/carnithine racemase
VASEEQTVAVSVDGEVARLTLSRAAKLNALNDDVRRALAAALAELEERIEVRVIVLAGEGRAFSAGADLTSTAYPAARDSTWTGGRHATGTWQRLLEQFDRIPQTTIARLHGHVIGGAALLAAACDIRIAGDDTVLRIPELAIGIPLTWAGIPLLVREVGLPLTRDWVMTCRPVAADELLRSGYAQRVVAPDELDAAVDACVAQLLAVPPGPLAMTRAMTAAIGRISPAMVAGWADADIMRWSLTEAEYRDAARSYVKRNLSS